ncbi:MAG: transcription elongation factor GreA [Spirochaetales bacterium]|nr:transcription elongation factor GreA [Spirochaetales bacterium]
MADVTKTVNELLNEEKWTRATLNSYSISNFKDLDVIIDSTIKEKKQEEVKKVCDEHLHHTKNSIIALYISGIIALSRQLVDDANLIVLINIFSDNHKWNIVEFLCRRILEFGENKFALRTLAECYENENDEENKYNVWERLIKVDYEEADIVRHLAERKEAEEDLELAVDYYKKAVYRYINKKLFSNVKDIWNKLIEFCPDDIDFFFHVDRKVEKILDGERASQLLEELYTWYKKNEDWERSIEILKRMLTYDPKNGWARKEIVDCFRGKYGYHSQLEEYIKLTNLSQSWRNVHDAISDFEKHISFDTGNFVCHRSWGIGRIRSIKDDEITIDFSKKRGHTMSLKMAVNALSILDKDHIWVLKVTNTKEDLKKRVKEDISWTLQTIINSYDNAASLKQIKAELVPSILSPGEWTSWSTMARKILKDDPMFGNLPEKVDLYRVRSKPISVDEKIYNKFKAEKGFFSRYKTLEEFLEAADPESVYFNEMFSYFTGFLKAYNTVNEHTLAAYLIVERIVSTLPFLSPGYSIDFLDLIQEAEDLETSFIGIEDSELRQDFLKRIQALKGWEDIYIRLFPKALHSYIISELESKGYGDKVRELFITILDNYRDMREAYIWLARNYSATKLKELCGITHEKMLIGLVHLLDITYREIENRREVSQNRKLNRQIQNYLFKEKRLEEYILQTDEESVVRLFTLLEDVKELDPSIRIELKHKIKERFPDFKFYGEAETERVSRGLLVTSAAYDRKQKELQYILDVEIPANAKEIGAAIELGDLSENAEYKAGKEKQEMLNHSVAKIKDELDRAQIFNPADVSAAKVSFGTRVSLFNNLTEEVETYTMLGPWESDPSKSVISYLSPFGGELLNHQVGETLEFIINDRNYRYTINEIEKADM